MRGLRTSVAGTKIDIVLVAARYGSDGRLRLAQGYSRRGVVWGDLRLYDRDQLVQQLRSGRRVVTGRPAELVGDFQLLDAVALGGPNGQDGRLLAEGRVGEHDDLGLPLF